MGRQRFHRFAESIVWRPFGKETQLTMVVLRARDGGGAVREKPTS